MRFQSLSKIYFIFSEKLNIGPSELDNLPFYFVEMLLQELEEKVDEENKRNKQQENEQRKQMDTSKLPKMDSYGGFKTPKMDIPKIPTPRL